MWEILCAGGSLSGGVNQKGVDHYNSLIDELIKNGMVFNWKKKSYLVLGMVHIIRLNMLELRTQYAGIEPCVTISHFDLPQALLDKYGGYLNRSFV